MFSHILILFSFVHSQLSEGSMEENCVVDGSRITLLPKAETGLLVSPFSFSFSLYIPSWITRTNRFLL
jgi:hypothetical protein